MFRSYRNPHILINLSYEYTYYQGRDLPSLDVVPRYMKNKIKESSRARQLYSIVLLGFPTHAGAL
jgi:hypothetical protein